MDVEVVEVRSLIEEQQQTNAKTYQIKYESPAETPEEIIASVDFNSVNASLSKINKLVVSGGGFLNYLWCAKHRRKRLYQILAPILLAEQAGIPIAFLGCTYGPWGDCQTFFEKIFAALGNTTLAARDKYSVKELQKVCTGKEIALLPDDLYFFSHKLNEFSTDRLPFKYVVYETYCEIAKLEENIDTLRLMVKEFYDKHGCKVVLLPFDKRYGGVYQSELIAQQINDVYFVNIGEYLSIEKCNEIIKNAEFVLCNRYHALVMSVKNAVPCCMYARPVNGDRTYYKNKAAGLLDMIDVSQEKQNLFYEPSFERHLQLYNRFEQTVAGQREIYMKNGILAPDHQIMRKKYIDDFLRK